MKKDRSIGLKPIQVERLQQLIERSNQVTLMAMAAEQNMHSYARSIADAHGIDGYKESELDPEKRTITFKDDK